MGNGGGGGWERKRYPTAEHGALCTISFYNYTLFEREYVYTEYGVLLYPCNCY